MVRTVILILAGCFALANAKSFGKEECPPKPDGIQTFDVVAYLGDWYQQAIIPYLFQPANSTCSHARYGNLGDGVVSVYNTNITPNGDYDEICGTAYQGDPENYPGDLVVGFPEATGNNTNYWILDTDYTTFSCVYSCGGAFGQSKEYAWILTREPRPDQSVIDNALGVFESNGLTLEGLEMTIHDESCIYESSPSCLES